MVPVPLPRPDITCKLRLTGSCYENRTVMVKMSSSYRISKTSEIRNPVNNGIESPVHAYFHTFFQCGILFKQVIRNIVLFLIIQSKIRQNNIENI